MSRERARFARSKGQGRRQIITPTLAAFCAAGLIAAGALIFDIVTPPVVSVGIFYVAIVLTGFWFPWPKASFALALLAAPLIIVGSWLGDPSDAPPWQVWANRTSDIGAVWLVAIFVWYIRVQAQELKAQNDIISTLSREIAHRVGNSLQRVASLLRLRAARATSETSREAFELAGSHVMCIGKIERMLSHSGSTVALNANTFITALIDDVRSTLPDPEKIRITVEADPAELSSTTAIALGVLLIELVNNALKHAFRGVGEGTLAIRFSNSQDTGQYIVEVEDDGVGIGRTQGSEGLGVLTVTELVRLMQGSIICEAARPSDARPGTKWHLAFSHGELH